MKPMRDWDVLMGQLPRQSPEAAEQAEMSARKALINAETDVRELKLENSRLRKALETCAALASSNLSEQQREITDTVMNISNAALGRSI